MLGLVYSLTGGGVGGDSVPNQSVRKREALKALKTSLLVIGGQDFPAVNI